MRNIEKKKKTLQKNHLQSENKDNLFRWDWSKRSCFFLQQKSFVFFLKHLLDSTDNSAQSPFEMKRIERGKWHHFLVFDHRSWYNWLFFCEQIIFFWRKIIFFKSDSFAWFQWNLNLKHTLKMCLFVPFDTLLAILFIILK